MQSKFINILSTLLAFLFTGALYSYDPAYTESNNELPNEIVDLKIVEKYGNQINLNLRFKNEKGELVRLKDFFNSSDRPVF